MRLPAQRKANVVVEGARSMYEGRDRSMYGWGDHRGGVAETSDEVGEIPLQHSNPITLNAKPFLLCLKQVKKFVVV